MKSLGSGRRRGFLFTMPLMLGMGMLIFASMIAISQLFVVIGGPMIPDLLADMPTIFHYTEDGQRIPQYVPVFAGETVTVSDSDQETLSEQEFAESFPALAMYGLMVKIALGIFVILLMLAGISYFFEEFNIVKHGTAYNIIAKMLVLVPIYFVLPYLWDMVALVIESSALYLMDPFGGDPYGRTTELWCMMGSAACSIDGTTTVDPLEIFDGVSFDRDSTLNPDSWNNSLQSPFFGEDFVINVLLSLFKGFAVMFMTAMLFVLSAIRVMLTEVIIISFPLVTAIGLIPWINTGRISDMFQQNLIGLSMAPIMSAIVLSVGLSTIDAQNMPPLRMWFQLLSIGFLAIFFPVMLSPMLGNLSTKVGNMVSTSIHSASVAGSAGLKGMARGMSQASGGIGGAGAVAGGIAGGLRGSVSSADLGTATSGVSPAAGISMADKIKLYGKAGAVGMLGGLGSGIMTSASQGLGVGGTSDMSNQMLQSSDARIGRMVQTASVDGIMRGATRQIAQIESGTVTPMQVSGSSVVNPGDGLNAMVQNSESLDTGQEMLNDPAKRQEFLGLYEKKMGLDMQPEVRQGFESKMHESIRNHPVAAGRLFRDMRSEP